MTPGIPIPASLMFIQKFSLRGCFNFRITQAGGRIFISPRVKHEYFVRGSYKALFNQYLQYAYWKVEVMRREDAIWDVRISADSVQNARPGKMRDCVLHESVIFMRSALRGGILSFAV